MTMAEMSQQVQRSLEYLKKNTVLAEQVVESFQALVQAGKQIPSYLVLSFTSQVRQLQFEREKLSETFFKLKQMNIPADQLQIIGNNVKSFERRIQLIESRAPTAQRDYVPASDDPTLNQKSLQQIMGQINELQEQKQEQIDLLAQNAKLLNNAASTFKTTLLNSNEKLDGYIDDAQQTKSAVQSANENTAKLVKEIKRDFFCWWLLGDVVCVGLFVMLLIFCIWGCPPKF
ncbi:Hypothetical_protein [Hexamita inflata]|uniref:Hypothetical_protein n=1 Tax=Hexamita inflata TaxID=28002 RepID=A0AA86Q4M9_9EUKA|nr:Hypothetical protein HINF_LOCUS39919 [Hexamita inflata]